MNINEIPTEQLVRGAVISIMDKEKPVIESFTDGEEVFTVASLNGVPIPYSIFLLHMAMRMAPMVCASYNMRAIPGELEPGPVFVNQSLRLLLDTWRSAELPSEIKSMMDILTPTEILSKIVEDLFTRHIQTGDDEGTRASFKEMVIRIDEDYASSLVDPILI